MLTYKMAALHVEVVEWAWAKFVRAVQRCGWHRIHPMGLLRQNLRQQGGGDDFRRMMRIR